VTHAVLLLCAGHKLEPFHNSCKTRFGMEKQRTWAWTAENEASDQRVEPAFLGLR
jgi:hypothetical protein